MDFEKMDDTMKDFIENILTHTDMKQSLVSLKHFEKTLHEQHFSKHHIDGFMSNMLTALFVKHYKLESVFGIEKGNDEDM
jgi:hypothetical protein